MLCMRTHSDERKKGMRQLEFCPDCGARLIPTPQQMKQLRTLARLPQREMAKLLGVKASHVAYLEKHRRNPSGTLILRYRKVEKRLLAKIKIDSAVRLKFVLSRRPHAAPNHGDHERQAGLSSQ